MPTIRIEPLAATAANVEALAAILVEVVAGGGSVGFMHPLPLATARSFWQDSLDAAGRGERIVLGAFMGELLAGTVTLRLDCPPNQPHRAEIAKMMTRPDQRGRGIGRALLQAAEERAIAHGRTLLVLDTASEEGAAGLYLKQGYVRAGWIPDYALKPHGGLTGTILFWKRIGT